MLFVLLGVLIFLGYGLYLFVLAEEIPVFIRTGVVAVVAGLVILLMSVIRDRISEHKGLKI